MARFAVFEAAVAPVCAPSSFSSQNLNSSRPNCSSPSSPPSPLPSSHSFLTTSERRISSNPSITSPKLSDSSSNNSNLVPTTRDTSMRTSHSDTNLMERFRCGSFMANLVGSRKSFTLQKRKSKKDKKQTSNAETTNDNTSHRSSKEIFFPNDDQTTELKRFAVLADVPAVPNNSAASEQSHDSQPSDLVPTEGTLSPAPPLHNSTNDYMLHSHTFFQQQQQQQHRQNTQSDSLSLNNSNDQKASNQVSSGSIKSKKSTSPTRLSKQHSSNSSSFEVKKSWLYPMTFINCCLTRTDSLPDVCLDANGNTQSSAIQPPNCNNEARGSQLEQRLAQMSNEENDGRVMGERMFIQSLNELFFNTNHHATPNPMISSNNGVQSQAEQERAIYLEEASDEAEWNSLHLSPSGRPTDEEQLHELRRLLHSHQHNHVYPVMSSFAQSDTERFFSPSNYPLHLSRMFGSFANQTIQNGESGEARHLNPANQYSISNFNSMLPYPPPSLFRLQRHSRAHSNPVHTQIDYINCLVPDLKAISNCSFYWGKMDRYEAERLLEGKPEGTFLLRDSAQEDHLFSVSFRRFDRSLHARIEQWKHRFSFDSHDPGVYSSTTVTGLIEHYKDPSHCMFFEPMLTKPLSRKSVFTLQHLARATICDNMSYGTINDLPLPIMLKSYLKEYHYRQKVRTKHFDEFTYLSNYFQS